MKKFGVLVLSVGFCFSVSAQEYEKPKIEATDHLVKDLSGIKPISVQAEFIGFRNPPDDNMQWQASLHKISPNESENEEELERIKEEKWQLRISGQGKPQKGVEKTTIAPKPPVVSTNFAGTQDLGGRTPIDNTIAISDKDTIIAMANSRIAFYTTSGTNFHTYDLYSYVGDVSLNNSLCDPKIIWDNTARRFIFYCQVCDGTSANSKIVLAFSKTSNPMDGFYFYKFSGNPLSNGSWWDYPKLAVSANDVFVTGNLFNEASSSFVQSVILQVQKSTAMSGTAPASLLWASGLSGAFTIMPLGYGQSGSYGPGIYAATFSGDDIVNGHILLYDITNKVGGSPSPIMNTYDVSVAQYGPPGNAPQMGGSLPLNTGDYRVQDGFYLKKTAHLVHNIDVGGGYSGFKYYRIDIPSLTATTEAAYSNAPSTDVAYPAIASAVTDSPDNSVVIAYEETSSSIYPRACVIACDKNGAYSAPVVVKAGTGYVNAGQPGKPYNRWGDYTGLCKRFGDPAASLWMAGMFGASSGHDWLQWIAKIGPKNVGVETVPAESEQSKVYPNPVVDRYNVNFTLPERQRIIINLTDMSGRTVAELYNSMVESGENNFSFNKGSLANGVYSLNIIGEKTNIRNEKIVVAGK